MIDKKTTGLSPADPLTGAELIALVQQGGNVVSTLRKAADLLKLTANKTLYVRKDGADTNAGDADSSAGAFLTIGRAVVEAYSYNYAGYRAVVQIGDGTYIEAVKVTGRAHITLLGNVTTPANVVINSTTLADAAVQASYGAEVKVSGLRIAGALAGLQADTYGVIDIIGPMQFDTVTGGPQIAAYQGGEVHANADYSIVGGATSHFFSWARGHIESGDNTITLVGTPGFSDAFASANSAGFIWSNATTFSGNATGKKFNGTNASRIITLDSGVNYFPGSSPGTLSEASTYDTLIGLTSTNIETALGFTPLSSITGSMVTTALGYTPPQLGTASMLEALEYNLTTSESAALTTGTKLKIRVPYGFKVTAVRGSLTTAATGATLCQFDVKRNSTSLFSTKPTFDATETTTVSATTPSVLAIDTLADDDELEFVIDAVGSTVAGAGLKVKLIGYRIVA